MMPASRARFVGCFTLRCRFADAGASRVRDLPTGHRSCCSARVLVPGTRALGSFVAVGRWPPGTPRPAASHAATGAAITLDRTGHLVGKPLSAFSRLRACVFRHRQPVAPIVRSRWADRVRVASAFVGTSTNSAAAVAAAWMSPSWAWVRAVAGRHRDHRRRQNVMLQVPPRSGPRLTWCRRGRQHLRPVSRFGDPAGERCCCAWPAPYVPHAALIAVPRDTSVLSDAVFYLMEPDVGESFNRRRSDCHRYASDAPPPVARYGVGLAMSVADAAAAAIAEPGGLGVAVGLGSDFGKPDGFPGHQVPRWLFGTGFPTRGSTTTPGRGSR